MKEVAMTKDEHAALYARVSSRESAERQDPEVQLVRLRERASQDGLEVYCEYVDHASGANPDRPALTRMLADARGHRFSTVYTVRVDRIMRSLKNFLEVLEELKRYHVTLVAIDQPIDTSSAMGRMFVQHLAMISEFERELIRERILDGLERARARGRVPGPNPIEVDMEEVLRMREDGMSLPKISAALGVSLSTLKRRLKIIPTISRGENACPEGASGSPDSDPIGGVVHEV